jgi:hypothetical protein
MINLRRVKWIVRPVGGNEKLKALREKTTWEM